MQMSWPYNLAPPQEHATVTTKPTAEGEATLNAFHVLGPAKRLAGKPLSKFEGSDLFLRVLQAEKAGLVSAGAWPACRGQLLDRVLLEPGVRVPLKTHCCRPPTS